MDISLILKVAGVGIIVSSICQILSKSGRDEQAGYVSIAGIIVVLFLLINEIAEMLDFIRGVFGI